MINQVKSYNGYRYCAVNFRTHVNGYVEIPTWHFLHGVNYTTPNKYLSRKDVFDIDSAEVGKRGVIALMCAAGSDEIDPETAFDVHGSITFSGTREDVGFSFAYGFDTAHYGDDRRTQNHEYVENECKRLIDQLIAFQTKYEEVR